MKTSLAVASLVLAMATAPAQAQSQSSDRYRRDEPPSASSPYDQQSQASEQRARKGEVENLRTNRAMSAPNVRGETVPESPNTGIPEAQERNQSKREIEGSVPRP